MNYIKQLNAFYLTLEYSPLSANAISLWHALMNIANRTGWKEYFSVANITLEAKSGLSTSSLQRARNELLPKENSKGFIEYQKGRNKQVAATYKVLVLYEQVAEQQSEQQSEQVTEQPSEHITKQNKTKQNETENKEPLTPLDDKPKKAGAKSKPKQSNKEKLISLVEERSFSDSMKKTILLWLEYKDERNDKYKPTGWGMLLTQIENNIEKYSEQAVIQVIEQCMASNYAGIIFNMIKKDNITGGADTYDPVAEFADRMPTG